MNSSRYGFRLWAPTALLAGLLLRLWFVMYQPCVAGDTFLYGDLAKNLLQHGTYGFTINGPPPRSIEVPPTRNRLPGYPLFLAACFRLFGVDHYRAVMYVQLAADLLTCCLAAALAGRLFGRRARLPVLWLAALCPFTASYVAAPLTETLVLTTIALAFYAFARWQDAGAAFNRWLWLLALALAASILLRPDQGLLAAAILPAMLWRSLASRQQTPGLGGPSFPASSERVGYRAQRDRTYHSRLAQRAAQIARTRSALPVLTAALVVLLPLVPWTLRNWRTFHVIQPLAPLYANDPGELAPLGFARWYRTWAIEYSSTYDVYWNLNGDRIELASIPQRAFAAASPQASASLRARTAALLADYNLTTVDTPAIDARFAALASERVRAHPVLYYLGLPLARLANMALRPRTEMMPIPLEWWHWSQHPAQTAFAAAYAALNLAYFAVALVGLYAWERRRWRSPTPPAPAARELAFAMAASILLRALLLLTIDNSEPRYTLEFFPILFIWIGALFAKNPQNCHPERSEGPAFGCPTSRF
jgi:hypothetical protein